MITIVTTYLLQKMNQFLHACLMTRGTEYFLLERSLLVQLQQHHLKIEVDQAGAPPVGLRVEHSRSEIQMEDPDVADASSLIP